MYATAEELQVEINGYFDQFTRKGRRYLNESRPTITGLVLYCGFESRTSFYSYEQKPEFAYTIKKARCVIENLYEDVLLTAKNAAGPIFALKNLGWKDEQSINVADTRAETAALFPEELLPGQTEKENEPDNQP